jgi:hypothetical protein
MLEGLSINPVAAGLMLVSCLLLVVGIATEGELRAKAIGVSLWCLILGMGSFVVQAVLYALVGVGG